MFRQKWLRSPLYLSKYLLQLEQLTKFLQWKEIYLILGIATISSLLLSHTSRFAGNGIILILAWTCFYLKNPFKNGLTKPLSQKKIILNLLAIIFLILLGYSGLLVFRASVFPFLITTITTFISLKRIRYKDFAISEAPLIAMPSALFLISKTHAFISENAAYLASHFLNLLGFSPTIEGTTLVLNNSAVHVGLGCNGAMLAVEFAFILWILWIMAPLHNKVLNFLLTLIGLFVGFAVNAFRIALLSYINSIGNQFSHSLFIFFHESIGSLVFSCIGVIALAILYRWILQIRVDTRLAKELSNSHG